MNSTRKMLINFWKRRKILRSINALDLVPIPLVMHEITEDGRIKLLIPRFRNKLLQQLFTRQHLSPEFKVSLDETGSKVWLLIDGGKNAGEITDALIKIYESKGLKFDSVEERVVAFITRLYQEDYISFRQIL